MTKQRIKELALANGFKLKEQHNGLQDLNPYVYEFAEAIEKEFKAQWHTDACQYEDGMPAQKAFWEGFERGSVAGGNNLNIREHWREYVGFKTGVQK